MNYRITCIGEVLIDFLPIERDGLTTGFTMHPGGGPFNVAVGLARLAQPVAFAGKLGADFFGRHLCEYAASQGIDPRFLVTSPAAMSTLAFVAHEHGEPVFTFYGEGAADTMLEIDDLPPEFFDETRILHCGGISLLRGSTPNTVLAAVERLRGKALISLDPNIRELLIADEPGYRALLQRLFDLVDVVKLSTADGAWLSPGVSLEQIAADLLARGPALVVITRGSAGVQAVRADSGTPLMLEAPAFPVEVADTVGAGDAFSAGLLAGLAERQVFSRSDLLTLPPDELTAVLRFAAATAALTCARPGADPPRREDVQALLR